MKIKQKITSLSFSLQEANKKKGPKLKKGRGRNAKRKKKTTNSFPSEEGYEVRVSVPFGFFGLLPLNGFGLPVSA